jgi:Xaa-Pro aminopeptidase
VQVGVSRGHAAPGDRVMKEYDLVTIDFGVTVEGYASDLQRTMVLCARNVVPPRVLKLWETTYAAVEAAIAVMKPGVTGLEVDTAARSVVVDAGYPEFVHATGHPLGRAVHDVGPMLGPDWPGRYGGRVHQELRKGMVFTLEPAAANETEEGQERVGLEEDVLVTADGVEFLAPRQTELWTFE